MRHKICLPLFSIFLFPILCIEIAFAQGDDWNPEDVEFVANCDQTQQKYVRVLPGNFQADQKYDLMIALHGHGSDRWQFVKDRRGECKSSRDMARKYGMIFISPDYRAKTSWMGPKAESDLLQIIHENRDQFRIGRILLCGGSMGGSSSLTFAAMHPELISGVVSMNGTANHIEYENFQEAIRESFGGTKKQVLVEYKKRSAEYWPEKLTMPVAFSTGGQDKSVPPHSVIRLSSVLKKINPDVLLIHRPETGHSTNYKDAVDLFEFVISRMNQKSG